MGAKSQINSLPQGRDSGCYLVSNGQPWNHIHRSKIVQTEWLYLNI